MPNNKEGLSAKYHLKDYVRYYKSAIVKNGVPSEFCDEQYGYVNRIDYSCNIKGEIELRYSIGEYVGSPSGHIVVEAAIIEKAKPEVDDFGYRKYLEFALLSNDRKINDLQIENKKIRKKLEEMQ